MFGLAHLAATLLLLQHSTISHGQNSNATEIKAANSTLITITNQSSNFSNIFSNRSDTDWDEYDFGNETLDSNITGRHAFVYHGYRPSLPPLLPPPQPSPILTSENVFNPHIIAPDFYPIPCKCLPFYLCKTKDIVGRSDGDGLIDQRSAAGNKGTRSPTSIYTRNAAVGLTADKSTSSSDVDSRTFIAIPRPVTNTFECRRNFVCCRDDTIPPPPPPFPVRPSPPKQIINPIPPPPPPPPPSPVFPGKQAPTCGLRNANGIVGRVKNPVFAEGDTQFAEFPWHVAILKNDESGRLYICAGALISDQYVVTAAHNIKGYNPREMRIRLGDWDVSSDAETFPFIERLVTEVYVHPYFYAGNLQNDIAILRLDHPVDLAFNGHIAPACLPPRYETFAGQRCVVTGWGKDAWGLQGSYSHILKKVDLPVLTNYDCQEKLRYTRLGPNFLLSPGFLCAGGEPGKDACKGDGGGPLVCEFDGRYVLAGIVSWGIGCGLPNVPGVYVRTSEYLDWINDIVFRF